uniref:Putative secreted protein n=1 Tax=Anopheles darlingi TaxID=43151 RepID=A0A2M4DA92_ANODA
MEKMLLRKLIALLLLLMALPGTDGAAVPWCFPTPPPPPPPPPSPSSARPANRGPSDEEGYTLCRDPLLRGVVLAG